MTRKSQAIIYTVYSFLSMVSIVLFMIYREQAFPSAMLTIWLLGGSTPKTVEKWYIRKR